MTIRLIPASHFSDEELTDLYNRTREDYLIPMQLTPEGLKKYMRAYDVYLESSVVALEGNQPIGLGMLGVRSGRSWITRLGVLPTARKGGAGRLIMQYLLDQSDKLGMDICVLEVIDGNVPAQGLFQKSGFFETRKLLVLRRAPGRPMDLPEGDAIWLSGAAALLQFSKYLSPEQPWTNQKESFGNGGSVMGLAVDLEDKGKGWLIFRHQESCLSHLVFHTDSGNPEIIARSLLEHLYSYFPKFETYAENISVVDPHLSALYGMGFEEHFRRIEMRRFKPVEQQQK